MANEEVAGMVVKLAMESSSFNDGIQNLNRQMKVVDSEFRTAVSVAAGFGDGLDGLKANSDKLSKSIEIQNQIVSKYQERLANSKKTLDSNVEAQIKLESELNKVKKAYDDAVSAIGKEAQESQSLKKELDQLQKSYDSNEQKIRNSQKAIDNNTISVNKAQEKLNKFKSELDSTNQKLEKASTVANNSGSAFDKFKAALAEGVSSTSIFGTKLGDLTSGFTGANAATAVLGGAIGGLTAKFVELAMQGITMAINAIKEFIASSLQIGIGFEAQMSRVQAITGETSQGLRELTDIARQFGADTVFTTTEVAKAMEYMGMAGWKTGQIMDGMGGVLSLAAASGEDLALVSDTVTDALTAFGESADQAGRMADVLSAAATSSNTNVGKMAYTFKYAAPVAGALSYTMEDVAIAMGLMANAGIKGETAGTSLRSMFVELLGTVEVTGDALGKYVVETQNADGSMRELSEIIGDLRVAFSGLTESERALQAESLVGKEAMSGLLAVVEASEEDFNKLTEAIYNSAGASEKMAQTMTDNVDGLMRSISSKFESIKISLYTFFEPLVRWVMELSEVIIAAIEPIGKALGDVGRDLLNLLTPVIDVFVMIGDIVVALVKGSVDLLNDLLGPALDGLNISIEDISGAIKMIGDFFIESIQVATDALKPFTKFLGEFIAATVDILTLNLDGFMEHTNNMWDIFTGKAKASSEDMAVGVENSIGMLSDAVDDETAKMLDSIVDVNSKTFDSFDDIYKDIQSLTGDHYDELKGLAKDYSDEYKYYDDVLTQYVRDGVREKEKEWDKLNEKNANKNTLEFALAKARYLKSEEDRLNQEVQAERDKNEQKYMALLKNSWEEQNRIITKNLTARKSEYERDYDAFKSNEEAKTKVFNDEERKRQGSNKGFLQGFADAFSGLSRSIPGYAKGTKFHVGGLALVGERGPEIVNLGRGAQVMTNGQTQQVMNGQASKPSVVNNYTFHGMTIKTDNFEEFLNQIQVAVRRGSCH